MAHKNFIRIEIKTCPICGSTPKREEHDLGRPGGHGYPGCVEIQLRCPGCGLLKGDCYHTIYESYEKAEQNAVKSWNKVADRVDKLITKTRGEK